MKAYKGFTKDMKCREFQFKEGETYREDTAKLCHSGFHACEDPIDCFNYYYPSESVYHEVELGDVSEERGDDTKVVAKTIKIGGEIGFLGIAKAHVEYVISHIKDDNKKSAHKEKDRSAATNTGNWSAATNTGNWSAATNTGDLSAATNTGNRSAATNTGNHSAATNTGDWSAATNTGNRSAATNTGDLSAATVTGKESVAISTGYKSKVRGAIGCAICCVERGEWNGKTYPIKAICAAIVDGEKIKADTWYTVKDGEFAEVDE